MALEISYEDEFGNINSAAYVRILQVQLDYGGLVATIEVATYKDSAARQADKKYYMMKHYGVVNSDTESKFDDNFGITNLDILNSNPLKAGYTYLKTLPEYSSTIDV